MIFYDDRADDYKIDDALKEVFDKLLKVALIENEIDLDAELSVSFVDENEIKSLNKTFRNIDKKTDVLSFIQYDDEGNFNVVDDQNVFLGDIVICTSQALEQARDYNHHPKKELLYLFVHGLAHLLGYDHMNDEDKLEMRSMEKLIFKKSKLDLDALNTKSDEELFEIAKSSLKNSYSPYSKISVSAAVLCENGEVYTGVNVENASFGAGVCAEISAIVSAISNGNRNFLKIAVTSSLENGITPCGICRQFILEFGEDIDVIFESQNKLKSVKIKKLIPDAFSKEKVEKSNEK